MNDQFPAPEHENPLLDATAGCCTVESGTEGEARSQVVMLRNLVWEKRAAELPTIKESSVHFFFVEKIDEERLLI